MVNSEFLFNLRINGWPWAKQKTSESQAITGWLKSWLLRKSECITNCKNTVTKWHVKSNRDGLGNILVQNIWLELS